MLLALVASLVAVAAWVYLLAGHGGFWRTDQRLPPAAADPAQWPAVVAVIPARDEAAVLPETLPTLLPRTTRGSSRSSWWTTRAPTPPPRSRPS